MIAANNYNNRNNVYSKHSTITFEPIFTEQYIIKIQRHNSNEMRSYYVNKIIITNETDLETIIEPYYSLQKLFLIITDEKITTKLHNVIIRNTEYVKTNLHQLLNVQIEITSSTLQDIEGYKCDLNSQQIINIFSYNSYCFNTMLTYHYNEYNYSHTEHLHKSKTDIDAQVSALINFSSYCPQVNYDDYIKNVYGTLKYVGNHDGTHMSTNILLLKSCLTFINTQQLLDNLHELPNEKLFRKYLAMTANDSSIIKNHKTYLNNIFKIKNRVFDSQKIEIENKHDLSLEFYMSAITCDDWMDVIEENKCFGIMVNICCPKATRLGYTYENIEIKECSNTLMTTDEVLKFQNKYIDEHGRFDMGFSGTSMIFGPGIGNGNSVLPIYINKYHWSCAKQYIEENISLAVTQNSFSFCRNMLYIYPQILMHYLIKLETLSTKDFHLFINIYVTIQELHKIYGRFDNDYKHFFSPSNTAQLSAHLNNALVTYMMHCQVNDTSAYFYTKIYEEKIRREIGKCSNITQHFKHYTSNKLMLIQMFTEYLELESVYKFMNIKQDFEMLVSEFQNNSGIILDVSINEFKKKFATFETYDYCTQVKSINSALNNNIIVDNLFLQSYITRKNKKRILSYGTKYRCILKSDASEIQENNKLISSMLMHHT